MTGWRLVIHARSDAAWNMAVDEAILNRYVAAATSLPPTLRLYGWKPAALSLGRGQPAAGAHAPDYLRENGIDLVRRPTGGRAVLHERERTYAVIGQVGSAAFPGGVVDTYRRVAAALTAALRRLGVEAESRSPDDAPPAGVPCVSCFADTSTHEIVARGRKLVGSAQLRRRGAFLQHGSILRGADVERLSGALGSPPGVERFTHLEELLGSDAPAEDALDRALVGAFEEAFRMRCERRGLSAGEEQRAAELRCWKYDSTAWTLHGKIGRRERRWGPPSIGGPQRSQTI